MAEVFRGREFLVHLEITYLPYTKESKDQHRSLIFLQILIEEPYAPALRLVVYPVAIFDIVLDEKVPFPPRPN